MPHSIIRSIALTLGLVATGCFGASSKEVATAKTATYNTTLETAFDQAMQATQENYKIGLVDAPNHRFTTNPQVYNSEGQRQSEGASGFVTMRAGSIQLHFVVESVPVENNAIAIKITPRCFQRLEWSPKPRELALDDPNLPGWVRGRYDALHVAVYQRLKATAIAPPSGPTR